MKPSNETLSSTQSSVCSQCGKKNAHIICGGCNVSLCKNCSEFLEESDFALLSENPLKTDLKAFCQICYQTHVIPALHDYQNLVEQAKSVQVFLKKQSKETRLIPRIEKPLKVENCKDESDVMMRLAIQAVQKNMNALIDLECFGKKVKDGSYTTTIYSGQAVPAEYTDKRVVKDRSIWQNPN